MRNFFDGKKEKKQSEIDPLSIFIPSHLDLTTLREQLEISLKENPKKEYEFILKEDELVLHKDIKVDPKKKKSKHVAYQILKKNGQFIVNAQKVIENAEDAKSQISEIDLYTKKDKVVEEIISFVNEQLDNGFFLSHLRNKMEFIASLSSIVQNFLLAHLQENEMYLACLGITNLTSSSFDTSEKSTYYFVFTSSRNLLLGSNGKECCLRDISDQAFDLTEKMGKDTITGELLSFDPELFNDSLFVKLKEFLTPSTNDRVKRYADVLFDKYNAKENHLEYIKKIYDWNNVKSSLKEKLKSFLLFQFPKKKCSKNLVHKELLLELIYTEPDAGNVLREIMNEWNISASEQYSFLELLCIDQDNFKLKNIAVFYDAALASLLNQKNPPNNSEEYRIKHLAFLKETGQYEKAIPFYEFALENLEDYSFLELISNTKTNVLDGEDCHPLRIQLLEELSEIKTAIGQSNIKELKQLAQLQPLVVSRLTDLAVAGIQEEKVSNILSLFATDFLNSDKETASNASSDHVYEKEALFALVVPESIKKAKGFLSTFSNLIAQASPPDYTQVTTYSEKLSLTNYPEAYKILKEASIQLSLDQPECYIGNGAFSKGIIGIEGNPNFLILGKNHLEPGTDDYLTFNELKFSIALELTHILFEHTRITSKDVWRGAKSKGMDIAGVLLIALPALSTVGNFAGKFINITKYTNLLSGVDRITNVVDKSQSAIEYGGKISEKFTANQKESELLATSRLMEISADRVGLLLTKDIKSSISALLKNNDGFAASKEKINAIGLHNYLSQQNEKGEFLYQELIIRIKTLCSFYLKQL